MVREGATEKIFNLQVQQSGPVKACDVKRAICERTGAPVEHQRLVVGREMTLKDEEQVPADSELSVEYVLAGGGGAGFSLPCCGVGCRCCEIQ